MEVKTDSQPRFITACRHGRVWSVCALLGDVRVDLYEGLVVASFYGHGEVVRAVLANSTRQVVEVM